MRVLNEKEKYLKIIENRNFTREKLYCTNGITRGYVKDSPFAALTLAIITHITLRIPSIIIIGIPIIIKHNGIARTI
jgi:hypothetical protein